MITCVFTVRPTCALAALLAARDAAAQALPGWNTKQFTFERIDADQRAAAREVEIRGRGRHRQTPDRSSSRRLQMNIKTGELSAIGTSCS